MMVVSLPKWSERPVGNKCRLEESPKYIYSPKHPTRGIFNERYCPAESEEEVWGQGEEFE